MKVQTPIVFLLLIFCLTTSLQCEKECKSSELLLDASKSWLPLKGKSQLTFLDNMGKLTNFSLEVVDTVENRINPDCDATIIYEHISVALRLNPPDRDVIAFSFNPPNFLVVTGANGNNPNFYIRDVFKESREGNVAKRLNNFTIGSRTYGEVILMFSNVANSNTIDSVFMANNMGIVGFNYMGNKYTLQ